MGDYTACVSSTIAGKKDRLRRSVRHLNNDSWLLFRKLSPCVSALVWGSRWKSLEPCVCIFWRDLHNGERLELRRGGGLISIVVCLKQNSRKFTKNQSFSQIYIHSYHKHFTIFAAVLYPTYNLSPLAQVCMSDTMRPFIL